MRRELLHHLTSMLVAAGMAWSDMMKNQPTSPPTAEECGGVLSARAWVEQPLAAFDESVGVGSDGVGSPPRLSKAYAVAVPGGCATRCIRASDLLP